MIAAIQDKLLNTQIGKYFIIGGVAAAIDVGVFLILHEFMGMSAILSHSISIPLSAIYSFTCNAVYNFKIADKWLLRFFSFSTVVALGYMLGVVIIWLAETQLGLSGTIGKFLSLPAVFIFQYFLNAKVSFRS